MTSPTRVGPPQGGSACLSGHAGARRRLPERLCWLRLAGAAAKSRIGPRPCGHMPADENPGAGVTRHHRHQEPETPDFGLPLPARAENVAVIRHAFGGIGDALDVPDHALADVKLAVTEACTNVVVHAYPESEGPMAISAGVQNGHLTVVVSDSGRGILPRPDSPGLGLGLPLIATLATSLELGTNDADETEVRMTFELDAAVPGASA